MPETRLTQLLRETPVLVTGMGAWTAAGRDAAETWTSALCGRSPAVWQEMPEGFSPGRLPVCPAATPTPEDTGLRPHRRTDRLILLAAAAARAAWRDAGLGTSAPSADRIAVVVGTSRGPIAATTDALEQLYRGRLWPSTAAHATPSSLSGTLAGLIGAAGPSLVVSSACASSASAIATAAQLLVSGAADVALAGGAEAPLHPVVIAQLAAAGVLASGAEPAQACRPFDSKRSGTVLGEGAAFLVLETAHSARQRSRIAHASLAGWGLATEPGERAGFSEDSTGLITAMRQALAVASLSPEDIGHVNAHGTGTRLNDAQEALAIREVFGKGGRPLVTSTKPVTGHCMGATGAIEAILAIEALKQRLVPPTANCVHPDPACGLSLALGAPRPCEARAVMTNSSGFWGNHASLIFSKA
jgi:3-oxoacyl-(acyl-carrier-protein) synthase